MDFNQNENRRFVQKMSIHFEKVCRTCMVESISLISIWSGLEPPSLAEMLSVLTASNVSFSMQKDRLKLVCFIYRFRKKINCPRKCV